MRSVYVEKNIPRMAAVKLLAGIWPGVIWSPFSPVHIVHQDEPKLPGSRWVRVRNHQCGICATDLSLLQVHAELSVAQAALPGNNRIYLGHETVGEIVQIGPGVTRFSEGDRVAMNRYEGPNCHTQEIDPPCRHCAAGQNRLCENASKNIIPRGVGGGWGTTYTAHEMEVWPVPDSLDDDQASLIEPMSVALHGVLRRPPEPEDRVLVIGAGIIGLLTLQAVKVVQPEARVTVMARYPQQVAAARRLGANEILGDKDTYAAVAADTGGNLYRAPFNRGMILGGYDLIFDCVGSRDTVHDSLRWARAGGTVVLVGISLGGLEIDLNPVWYQEVDLIGSYIYGVERWRGRQKHTYELVIEMLQEGALTHEGLISHRFPLAEIKEAVATALDKSTGSIKVMVEID